MPTLDKQPSGSVKTDQIKIVTTDGDKIFNSDVSLNSSGSVEVQDEGISLTTAVTKFNFAGVGITVTEPSVNEVLVTVPASAIEVVDEVTSLTSGVTKMTFAGAGITVTEPITDEVLITVPSSSIEVQDEGSSLTTTATKFNFVGDGVVVTEPTANELLVTIATGVSAATSEYCPGYTFVFIDTVSFRIDGFDVTNLFNTGRRVKFSNAGVDIYGEITSSTFSTNTTINLTMESGATLSNVAYEVCLTAGTAGWSPIATDPFGGTAINALVSGLIGATIYWIAVGDSAKVYYSTDAGITWTAGTGYSSSVDFHAIAYDSANERFMLVGDDGVFMTSTDGTSWTIDTTSIKALAAGGGTENCDSVSYDVSADEWTILWDRNTASDYTSHATAVSVDFGATWAEADLACPLGFLEYIPYTAKQYTWTPTTAASLASLAWLDGPGDTASSNFGNFSYQLLCVAGYDKGAGIIQLAVGMTNGRLATASGAISASEVLDDVTLSNNINGVVYSSTHGRFVAVSDLGEIAYIDAVDFATVDSWTAVTNGFNPLANILDIHWDDTDGIFIAVASNGQICRSSNGTN